MKRVTLIFALLLCLVLCVFAFASCGKKKKTPTDVTGETADQTSGKWDAIGEEVSAFASEDRKIKIQYDMSDNNHEKNPTNDKYIEGPDKISSSSAKIDTLVFNRNKNARDLLGVEIQYSYWNDTDSVWGKQAKKIRLAVEGNDPSAPDLFIDMIYDLNKAMKTKGVFKDIKSIPGSYFDFTADGWMTEWMESLSFTGDRAYVLGSDYFIDILRGMGVLPFNMEMMNAGGSKLAKALFGADLNAGETMSQRFFDYVEKGDWTWDSLKKLCEAIWVDGGAKQDASDFDDTLGILVDKYSGLQSSIVVYSTGVSVIETYTINDESDENNGKIWARYYSDSSLLGEIFDAVANVFTGNGAYVTNSREDGKGFAEHYAKFASNTLLFAGPVVLAALEDDAFQQMEYAWSVVPLPKASVDKEYNTVIHNIADAGAINVRTTPGKARAITAYLQYCTENSVDIREEFLQTVTKYRTTTYNQGTDRMLDLIYDHIITGRDKALEDVSEETSGRTSASWMKAKDFAGGSSYVVQQYQEYLSTKQESLNEIFKKWYTLPTVETEAEIEWPTQEETSETPAS